MKATFKTLLALLAALAFLFSTLQADNCAVERAELLWAQVDIPTCFTMQDNRMKRIGSVQDCPTESDKRYYESHAARLPEDVLDLLDVQQRRNLRTDYNICMTNDYTARQCHDD